MRTSITGTLFLLLATASCSHPKPGTGNQSNPSGAAGGSGTSVGPAGGGSGTSATPGAGTSGGPVGNAGTSAGGGPGEQVVDPDAGSAGGSNAPMVMRESCPDRAFSDPWFKPYAPDPAVMAQVDSTVGSLSIAEKADQMRGTPKGNGQYTDIFRTPDNTGKGILGFKFRDGPRGLNLAAELPSGKQGYATAFPVPIARAAAFDMDLEYRIGVAIGDETLASGNTMMLSPTVNILRHPAWGRAQETYGEDVFLLGRMGTAHVVGVQEFVPACVKHYAANNIENGRGSANAKMDEQTLREIYARHFEMIIEDGGVACVMAAYNQVNDEYSTQSKHLLSDVLRTDFGFRGLVLSDWWAMPGGRDVSPQTAAQNAAEAVQAGLDIELPWALNYVQLESITGAGRPLVEADLTRSASRIIEQKLRFKVAKSGTLGLRRPTSTFNGNGSVDNAEHVKLAREAARKSMVLLKNDAQTLPLDRTKIKTLAVIGAVVNYTVADTNDQNNGVIDFARTPRLGDLGSSRVFSDPEKSTGPAAGITAIAGAGVNVVSGADAALADNADFVVVVAGMTPLDEGEEYTRAGDRPNFRLDGKSGDNRQNDLIMQVAAKGKPMVVVLEAGSVIEMPWLSQVPAVVMAWYPGMDGGAALGELLFGVASFGGKLPITWPKRWEDEPNFVDGTTTTMDYYLGYRHFDQKKIEPLFPFGHGLGYTKFAYGGLSVPCSDVTKNGIVDVSVEVANEGSVAGDEVVLVFVSYPETKVRRSVKELKGFYRVSLDPGQKKRVTIPVRVSDLKYWDMQSSSWQIESGRVNVMVGPNAATLPLQDSFTVK